MTEHPSSAAVRQACTTHHFMVDVDSAFTQRNPADPKTLISYVVFSCKKCGRVYKAPAEEVRGR